MKMETETEGGKIKFIKTERSSFNDIVISKNAKLSINEATNNVIPDDIFKFNRFIIQNSHRSTDRHKHKSQMRDSKTPLFLKTMNRPFVDSSINLRPMTAKSKNDKRYNSEKKKKKKQMNTSSMKQLTQTS